MANLTALYGVTKLLVSREILSRNTGTVFGVLWLILLPVLLISVYTFVFGYVFKNQWPGGAPGMWGFMVNMFSGLIPLALFGEVFSRSSKLILDNMSYVKKSSFPVGALCFSAVISAFFTALVSYFILLFLMLMTQDNVPLTFLLIPFFMAPLLILTAGVSLLLSSVGVYFKDTNNIVGVINSLLLFVTPVFYPISAVPPALKSLIQLNPISFYSEASRSLTVYGVLPEFSDFATAVAIALTVAVGGWAVQRRLRAGFIEAA